jgi:hypothetical protein
MSPFEPNIRVQVCCFFFTLTGALSFQILVSSPMGAPRATARLDHVELTLVGQAFRSAGQGCLTLPLLHSLLAHMSIFFLMPG